MFVNIIVLTICANNFSKTIHKQFSLIFYHVIQLPKRIFRKISWAFHLVLKGIFRLMQ